MVVQNKLAVVPKIKQTCRMMYSTRSARVDKSNVPPVYNAFTCNNSGSLILWLLSYAASDQNMAKI